MIDVRQVSVAAGEVTLLAPVSMVGERGEVLVVRGRNGTGKSTLLRVLAGARAPSSGTVRIGGRPVARRDPRFRGRVAAMIGLPPTAPDLTLGEHVRLVAATWSGEADAAEELSKRILAELGLTELSDRFPHELSSGQTQLFGIALVLARPFDVLLLDEPEQRLDTGHIETVIRVLSARRDEGATLVVATHSAVLAEALADRTIRLDAAA